MVGGGSVIFDLFGDTEPVGVDPEFWGGVEGDGLELGFAEAISAFLYADVSGAVVSGGLAADCVEFVFGLMRGRGGVDVGEVGGFVAA